MSDREMARVGDNANYLLKNVQRLNLLDGERKLFCTKVKNFQHC